MDLLTCVNNILPFLEENTVTTTDTQNPTVQLLLDKIEMVLDDLFATGYWFNTEFRTLPLTPEGRIETPTSAIAIYPSLGQLYEFRGEYLYDLGNSTYTFQAPVYAKMLFKLDFTEIPYPAQLLVQWRAAVHAYTQDYGVETTVQFLMGNEAKALAMVEREHLRKMRYNSMKSGAGSRYLSALRT